MENQNTSPPKSSPSKISRFQKSTKSAFSKVRKTLAASPLIFPKSSNNNNNVSTVQTQKKVYSNSNNVNNSSNSSSFFKKIPLFSPNGSQSSDCTTPKISKAFRKTPNRSFSITPKSPFRPISQFDESIESLSPRVAKMNVSKTVNRLDFSSSEGEENDDTPSTQNDNFSDSDTLKTESEKNSQNSIHSQEIAKILPEINADSEITLQNTDSGCMSQSQPSYFRKPSSSVPLESMISRRDDYVPPPAPEPRKSSSQNNYTDNEIGPSGMVQSNYFIPINPSLEIPPFQPNQQNSMSTPKLETTYSNMEPSSAFPEFCPNNKINLNTPIQSNKKVSKITPRTPNYINHRDRADKRGKLPIPVMSGKPGSRKHAFHGEGIIHFDLLEALILKKPPYENIKFKIIDCRYPYEFNAGHIKGAINIYLEEQAISQLFKGAKNIKTCKTKNSSDQIPRIDHTILIFHCEFSSLRAPKMGNFVRNYDRRINYDINTGTWPELSYPTCVLLDNGFQGFYNVKKENSQHLFGKVGYTKQHDKQFSKQEQAFTRQIEKSRNKCKKIIETIKMSKQSQQQHKTTKTTATPIKKKSNIKKRLKTTGKNIQKLILTPKTPEIRKTKFRAAKRQTICKAKVEEEKEKIKAPKKRKRTTSIRERLPSAENLEDEIQKFKKQRNNTESKEEVNVEIRQNKINSSTPSPTKITTPKQQTYLVNNENTTESNTSTTTSTQRYSKMRKKLDFC